MNQTEQRIQFEILQAWGSHDLVRLARVNTGGAMVGPPGKQRLVRFNPPGTADIVGILAPAGRMIMLECKTATGRQRDAQIAMSRVVKAFGGVYEVVRSLADADRVFAALGLVR